MLVFSILLLVGACSAIEDFHKVGDDAKLFSRLDSLFSPSQGKHSLISPSRLPSFLPNPSLRVFHSAGSAPWDLPSKPLLSFPWTRRNSAANLDFPRFSDTPFKKTLFSDRPIPHFPLTFPHFPTVRPLLKFKNTERTNIWEDFFDKTETDKQDQDRENFFDTTETSTNQPRKDFFHREFTFQLHGDPLKKVAGHVNTFRKDMAQHVVSPLLNLFNRFLDSAINVEIPDAAANSEDEDEKLDEFIKNHHSEILDPSVVEHTGLPTPNIDTDLDEDFKNLDPNVEVHMGLPSTDVYEDKEEENIPTEVINPIVELTRLPETNMDEDIVDIDQIEPVFDLDENADDDSETLASGVVEHTGIQELMKEIDLDIDQVDPEVDIKEKLDEGSETLASGVAEHTGISDLMALLDDVQEDTPQTKESAQETQPEGFEYKTQKTEGSHEDSNIPAFYSVEPIVHLLP